MNSSEIDIQKVRKYLSDQPVMKAYIFGSYARNEVLPDTDFDLLVELDNSQSIGLKFVTMKLELEALLNRQVDILSDRAVSKYIRPNIEAEKKLIYEIKQY